MVSTAAAPRDVAVIGAGPAGLYAAEIIANAGHRVTVYERMPSPARKFLLAGRGGLNLTHSEPLENFLTRYRTDADNVRAMVESFPPATLVEWANGLGADTFIGSSGRVFPRAMKASPLLRAWLRRLGGLGVVIKTRHRWTGFAPERGLLFETPEGTVTAMPDATLFALGGGSWPKLGSDAHWTGTFSAAGIPVTPLAPANCGVRITWSEIFKSRFEGAALKRIALTCAGATTRGEAIVTRDGLEGGAIYALIPHIRSALRTKEGVTLSIDLKPDVEQPALAERLAKPRGKETLTNFLRKATHLDPAALALLREAGASLPHGSNALAARIKSVPLSIVGVAGIERAISTAGGIDWSALDHDIMIKARPGVFAAGEMLDWEAPTGGYLLQATFATAARAANGLVAWLARERGH
ncbi:TIGR03862 family flavoprotein [Hyphomicrobium sp.]|uniref:TIGR03862 family flavoprotein n=1 Tax=Hyphomicrobium sp. TaxID=82 RepID=UPI001DEE1FB7|nr:TIGR03862 family flavoprotein [Hyphomicrobium sp.]MBY0560505.1 TIGR03862 family flavoprotein [Hyphomicrobium sp.]